MLGYKLLSAQDASKRTSDSNNFLYIRLIASTMVVLGHSIVLSKDYNSGQMGQLSLFGFSIHGIGVLIFFCLSGYLVTGSLCQRKSIIQYTVARAIRIFPGLAICLILSIIFAFVFLSDMDAEHFFKDAQTWCYLLNNLSLYKAEFYVPGVTYSINGSLWTIPIEGRLYIGLAVLWLLFILRYNLAMLTASSFIIYASWSNLIPGTLLGESNFRLVTCFLIGATFYTAKSYIPLSIYVSFALFGGTYLFAETEWVKSIFFFLFVGYTTLLIAYAPKIPEFKYISDYSYGIYLYAFVIQTTLLHYFPEISALLLAVFSVPLAWMFGAASWHFVEKPCLSLKNIIPAGGYAR